MELEMTWYGKQSMHIAQAHSSVNFAYVYIILEHRFADGTVHRTRVKNCIHMFVVIVNRLTSVLWNSQKTDLFYLHPAL